VKSIASNMQYFLALVMAGLMIAEPVAAETPGAMLTATGATTVNGQPISENTVIFNGDKIQIGSGSAILRPKQFVAMLDPNTAATYVSNNGKDALAVQDGSGTIALNSKDASVTYLGLTVRPQGDTGKLVIGLEHGRRALMASGSPLLISKGGATMVLPAGSALVQDPQAAQPPQPAQPGTDQQQQTTTTTTQAPTEDNSYCSEENQAKHKDRRKKCAGGAPHPAFEGFNVVAAAIVAAGILAGALYAFGAFSSPPSCASPPCVPNP
jgi:pSer/pThr/pTyr-binding forkhead associated (FHA) protein